MLLKNVLEKSVLFLKNQKNDKGELKVNSARLDSELLIAFALNLKRIDLYLRWEQLLTKAEINLCRELIVRRSQGEPVAYIVGKKGFFNHDFFVDPRVLIPRPETETLVEKALEYLKQKEITEPLIYDLGTGSGCIAISVLLQNPNAKAILVEASAGAAVVAQKNLEQFNLSARAKIICCEAQQLSASMLTSLPWQTNAGKAQIVLANPPYISEQDDQVQDSVKKYEPHSALFAKENGLQQIEQWVKKVTQILQPGGLCAFEIGSTQGKAVQEIFNETQFFSASQILQDLAGLDRVVWAYARE